MIAYIKGNITDRSPSHVVIESGGLGYTVQITLNTYSKIEGKESVKLHTYLHFGGNLQSSVSVSMYGFYEEAERDLFIQLLSVSGIGTSTVRMILSALTPQEVQQAIASDNTTALERIKGIGPKTAKRMVLELKDKFLKPGSGFTLVMHAGGNNKKEEALAALTMLGFNRQQSEITLQRLLKNEQQQWTVEELVKQSLRTL